MRNIQLHILISFFISVSCSAQVNFKKTYRPSGTTVAAINTISAAGGGYYMAGHMYDISAPLNTDIYILKVDESGDLLWWKRYDSGVAGLGDQQCSVAELPSGDIILKFNLYHTIDTIYIAVARLDSSGNVTWIKTFDPGEYSTSLNVVLNKNNGNILVPLKIVGNNSLPPFNNYDKLGAVEMDLSGNVVRSYAVGYGSSAWLSSFEQTIDGGFIIAGVDHYSANYGGLVAKLNAAGNLEWGIKSNTPDPFCSSAIIELPDSSFAWTFTENCYQTPKHRGVARISSTGVLLNSREIFAQTGDTLSDSPPILHKSEDGHIFLDWIKYNSSVGKRILIPVDTAFNFLPGKLFDFSTGTSNTSVVKVVGNDLIIGGGHSGNPGYSAALYRTSSISTNQCGEGPYSVTTGPYTFTLGFSNPFVSDTIIVSTAPIISLTSSNVSGDSLLCQLTGVEQLAGEQNLFFIYPNPVNSVLTIHSSENMKELKIVDVLGNEFYQTEILNSTNELHIPTSDLSIGVYFIKLKMGNRTVTKKFLKL